MVGLQLTVPLSTGGWRSAKLEDSLRQHEAAQATLEQQREQVAQQVHSAWLGLHLVFLAGFRNRISVFVNWAWNYLTWDRGPRLILREPED